jgi:uncharacterized protein (TIGR02444 family)
MADSFGAAFGVILSRRRAAGKTVQCNPAEKGRAMTREEFCQTLWAAMVRRYTETPGLMLTCLALQDHHGVDVVMALFLWLADAAGLSPTEAEAAALQDAVQPWRQNVVLPLRGVRNWQKAHATAEAELAHRESVKALELQAERLELDLLAQVFRTQGGGGQAAARQYLQHLGAAPDLIAAFLAV